jgi:hypothetical protein
MHERLRDNDEAEFRFLRGRCWRHQVDVVVGCKLVIVRPAAGVVVLEGRDVEIASPSLENAD